MRIGVRLPQYAATWDDIVAAARLAERRGFDGIWVNDHLQSPGRIKAEPTFEALTTLAALATLTQGVRLGVMVLSSSYRPPALAAKMTTVLDVISGGRMVVGLGTGSDVAEHSAYGYPFPDAPERTARLMRTLEIFRAMRDNPDGATVEGLIDRAPNRPAARPPLWVAAHKPRLLRLAGQRADGLVSAFLSPDEMRERIATASAARPQGRAPLDACLYAFLLPLVPETDGWLAGEAEALQTTPAKYIRWLATKGAIVAPPDELPARLAEYEAVGATDAVLALPSRTPPELMDAVADAVLAPQ